MDAAWVGIIISIVGTIVTIVVLLWNSGRSSGIVTERIKGLDKKFDKLEEKVEKHNCLMERMAAVERDASSAHHRIDRLDGISDAEAISK